MTPKQFKAALRRLDWGPADAAAGLKVDRSCITRWLSGKRKVPELAGVALDALTELKQRTYLTPERETP